MEWIFQKIAITVLLMTAAASVLGQTAPPPATSPEISSAIAKLGSEFFKDREESQQWLWIHADQAESALKEAMTSSTDAEVRMRAKLILDNVMFGLPPDASQDSQEMVRRCLSPEITVRRKPIEDLLQQRRIPTPAMFTLLEHETDGGLMGEISESLTRVMPDVLEDARERGELTPLLLRLEKTGDFAMVRQAAAVRALMEEFKITEARNVPKSPNPSPLMRYMEARVRGDWKQAGNQAKTMNLFKEQMECVVLEGDWDAVIGLFDKSLNHDLFYAYSTAPAAAFANHGLMPEATARTFAPLVAQHFETFDCTPLEMLMMSGQNDSAVQVLLDHGQFAHAIDLLAASGHYTELDAILARARIFKPTDAWQAEMAVARARYEMGDSKTAETILKTAEEQGRAKDFLVFSQLIGVRSDDAQKRKAKEMVLLAMAGDPVAAESAVSAYFRVQSKEMQFDVASWLGVLNTVMPPLTNPRKLQLLEEICQPHMPPDDATALAKWREASGKGAGERITCDLIASAATGPQTPLEMAARRGIPGWATADAVIVDQAPLWRNDPAIAARYFMPLADAPGMGGHRAVYTYMIGWALHRAADPAGPRLMAEGTVGMGASTVTRRSLIRLLLAAGDIGTAMEEGRRMLRICDLHDDQTAFTLKDLAEAARQLDDPEAARLDTLFLFLCTQVHTGMIQENDLMTSFQIGVEGQHSRILGALKKKDLDGASNLLLSEAKHWGIYDDLAGDVVTALAIAGNGIQADAIIAQWVKHLEGQLKDFPNSDILHNQLAWFLVRTRRDLPAARSHAETALAISPANWRNVETLAEVEWATGHREKAVALEESVVRGQPDNLRPVRRLDHYKKDPLSQIDID